MRSAAEVAEVLRLREQGLGARRIAARTGLPVGTVRDWLAGRVPKHSRYNGGLGLCASCGHATHQFDALPDVYCYLLGLYLGDGCISAGARGVFRLRINLDLAYPAIVDECEVAIRTVVPGNRVYRLLRRGNFAPQPQPSLVEVSAYSKSWPCLFPQHGPGRKHQRAIRLSEWQYELVQAQPELLLRGLIHSDGCRFMNTGRGGWRCPRYVFNNESADIRRIFTEACEVLGLHCTFAPRSVYVSRKTDVLAMDTFIGPKR